MEKVKVSNAKMNAEKIACAIMDILVQEHVTAEEADAILKNVEWAIRKRPIS